MKLTFVKIIKQYEAATSDNGTSPILNDLVIAGYYVCTISTIRLLACLAIISNTLSEWLSSIPHWHITTHCIDAIHHIVTQCCQYSVV